MKNSLPSIAFFSIRFMLLACTALPFFGHVAHAQNVASAPATTATTHGVKPVGIPQPQIQIQPAQIQPVGQLQPLAPQIQVISQANINLVAPIGGETYVNGNRYNISWHANIPEIKTPYHLLGEIRLLDQSTGPNKKDLRIARLNEVELAKGTYQFLAGSQTEMQYGHTAATEGQYKVWMFITGYTDCAATAKCAPLFEATAITPSPITIKYH